MHCALLWLLCSAVTVTSSSISAQRVRTVLHQFCQWEAAADLHWTHAEGWTGKLLSLQSVKEACCENTADFPDALQLPRCVDPEHITAADVSLLSTAAQKRNLDTLAGVCESVMKKSGPSGLVLVTVSFVLGDLWRIRPEWRHCVAVLPSPCALMHMFACTCMCVWLHLHVCVLGKFYLHRKSTCLKASSGHQLITSTTRLSAILLRAR